MANKLYEYLSPEQSGVQVMESKDGKDLFMAGLFIQGDVKNQNGRVYPKPILEREAKKYLTFIKERRALGELDHPDSSVINLNNVSHKINKCWGNGNDVHGQIEILPTPSGNIAKALFQAGVPVGISSRGMGSLKNKSGVAEVQNDFYLATAADIVADPSAPDAFVEGIMEGKEWVWDNGIIREATINDFKEEIEQAPSKDLTETKLKVWSKFLSNL